MPVMRLFTAKKLIAAGAAFPAWLALSLSTPAAAPPRVALPCGAPPEAWEAACLKAGGRAQTAAALARLRGGLNAAGVAASAVAEAEALARDAAHVCAEAERWERAEDLVRASAALAGERALRMRAAPAEPSEPAACQDGMSTPREDQKDAFEAYRLTARLVAVEEATRLARGLGVVDGEEAAADAQKIEDRRCVWIVATGRARALEGLALSERGESADGLLALSAGLQTFDRAQNVCRGPAKARVAQTRRALAEVIEGAMGLGGDASAEAAEIRLALLEESPGRLGELLGLESVGEQAALFGHAGADTVAVAHDEPLGLANGARRLGGDAGGAAESFIREPVGGKDAGDEAPVDRLGGVY
jgi:hypothetical protein